MLKGIQGRKKMKLSIRFKLMIFVIPIVIAAIVAISLTLFRSSYRTIYNEQNELLTAKNNVKASEIEQFVTETISTLNAVQVTLENVKFNNDAEILEYLTMSASPNYPTGIYLGDNEGNFIDPTGWVPPEDYVITERNWYIEGLNNETFKFGEPYIDADTGGAVVSACTLLKSSDSKIKRVASADIAVSEIVKKIEATKEAGVVSFLIDKSTGVVLASTNAEILESDKDIKAEEFVKALTKKINEGTSNETKEGVDKINGYVISSTVITNTDWSLVSCTSLNIINDQKVNLQNQTFRIAISFIIILIIMMEIVIRLILKPIKSMTLVIERMTSGDFRENIKVKGKDEIAAVSENLHKFILQMREIINQIYDKSENILVQADEGKNISDSLIVSAESQCASMEQLNRTVDELAKSVSEIAGNANHLASVVAETDNQGSNIGARMAETTKILVQGKIDMQKVTTSMEDVENSILSLEEVVGTVGEHTNKIWGITKIIDEIAKQINLLGLNASIEAARFGDKGNGFAIVANEIQKLAKTSSTSVKNISDLVNEIAELVTETGYKTKQTVKTIKDSHEDVNVAYETFNNIYDNIEEANIGVTSIIKSVKQIEEVAVSVAAITQEQSAGAQEILATSENVYSQAKELTNKSERLQQESETLDGLANELKSNISVLKI